MRNAMQEFLDTTVHCGVLNATSATAMNFSSLRETRLIFAIPVETYIPQIGSSPRGIHL